MSDFKNPDAGWYFDQFEALRNAGGKVSREEFVGTCHIFRAAGYNEALAAAAPDDAELADMLAKVVAASVREWEDHGGPLHPVLHNHLAAALAPWVAQREAEALREALQPVRAVVTRGHMPGDTRGECHGLMTDLRAALARADRIAPTTEEQP